MRSVVGHIAERAGLDPREAHKLQNEALQRRHVREKLALEGRKKALDKIDQRERAAFERDLRREALGAKIISNRTQTRGTRAEAPRSGATRRRQNAGRLSQDFNAEAQSDPHARDTRSDTGDAHSLRENWDDAQKRDRDARRSDPRLTEGGKLREEFDAAANARDEGDGDDDGDDDGRKPKKTWKQRAQEKGGRRGRGRGYGSGGGKS